MEQRKVVKKRQLYFAVSLQKRVTVSAKLRLSLWLSELILHSAEDGESAQTTTLILASCVAPLFANGEVLEADCCETWWNARHFTESVFRLNRLTTSIGVAAAVLVLLNCCNDTEPEETFLSSSLPSVCAAALEKIDLVNSSEHVHHLVCAYSRVANKLKKKNTQMDKVVQAISRLESKCPKVAASLILSRIRLIRGFGLWREEAVSESVFTLPSV